MNQQHQLEIEKPEQSQPREDMNDTLHEKGLLWWRMKHMFWGRNSITTAVLIYGTLWFSIFFGIVYLLNTSHIYPEHNSWQEFIGHCVILFIPSLFSAYVTAKTSPKWSTFAVGLISGGLLGWLIADILKFNHTREYTALIILIFSNISAFFLARKIRNKHFGIDKPKNR
jgi:hypothetical protein